MPREHGAHWKGGRQLSGHGYIRIHAPDHPRAGVRRTVYEHVLVVERALGHYLPPHAEVHHVDDDGTNNAPSNLVACQDRAYHKLLHQRRRALLACGNPSALPCCFCHTYDRQAEIVRAPRRRDGKVFVRAYHRDCEQRDRARRAQIKRNPQ